MLPSVGKTHGTWVKCKNLVCLFLRSGDQTQISNPFYRYLKHLVVQPADTIFHAQKQGFIFSLIIYNMWSHFYFSSLCSFLWKKSPFKKVKEKKIKKQARYWEKLFVNQISDKGLISRIYIYIFLKTYVIRQPKTGKRHYHLSHQGNPGKRL